MNTIVTKTPNNNFYLLNLENQLILYIDPVIAWFYKNNIIRLNKESTGIICEKFQISQEEVKYKFTKYKFINNKIGNITKSVASERHTSRQSDILLIKNIANIPLVLFEVTQKCNLKCKYCGYGELYSDYDPRVNLNLSFRKAKAFINYLVKIWASSYNLSYKRKVTFGFYGGEPLMNFDLIQKIIEYLKSLKIPNIILKFNMTTNGTLIDRYIDTIVKNDFQLLISIDGNKRNNMYRVFKNGKSSFNRLFMNILKIKEKYPIYFQKNISFISVLHDKNSVIDIHNFIQKHFGKKPKISTINSIGIIKEKKKKYEIMHKDYDENIFSDESLFDINKQRYINNDEPTDLLYFIHAFSGNVIKTYNDFFIDIRDIKFNYTGTCSAFSRRVFLTVNGKILPCERVSQNLSLGSVIDDQVKIDYKLVADKYAHYLESFKPICNNCKNKYTCLQCMFNVEDINVKKCKKFMNNKQFVNYLNCQLTILEKFPEAYQHIMHDIVIE